MSTSGRQKNPRSARMTRKSCASASIAAAGERVPLHRGDGRHRQREQPREQRVHVDRRSRGTARRCCDSHSRSRPFEKNFPRRGRHQRARALRRVDRGQVLLHRRRASRGGSGSRCRRGRGRRPRRRGRGWASRESYGDARWRRVPDNDLLPLLRERLLGLYSPLLADTDRDDPVHRRRPGDLDGRRSTAGRASARRRHARRADHDRARRRCRCCTDVVSGRRSGVEAFLAGDLTVRGNLALALQLDGLFPGDPADDTRTLTRSVHADGIETFYLESGPHDAPPVVLVHGLSATNASMLPMIPALAQSLPRARARPARPRRHAGDARRRTARPTSASGSPRSCARPATEPAVLVGNSLGGRTALQAALDAPDAVRGLVLLCPAVAFRKLRQLVPFVRLVPDQLVSLPMRLPRAARDARAAQPVRRSVPAAATTWYDVGDRRVRARARDPRQPARHVLGAAARLPRRAVRRQTGSGTGCPTCKPPALFLWGDRDVLVPAGFGRFVTEALPDARSVVLRRLRSRAAVRASRTDHALHDRVHRVAGALARCQCAQSRLNTTKAPRPKLGTRGLSRSGSCR